MLNGILCQLDSGLNNDLCLLVNVNRWLLLYYIYLLFKSYTSKTNFPTR